MFLRRWLPFYLFAALIFILSSIPGDGLPLKPLTGWGLPLWIAEHPDKIAHAILYGIFGWLCFRAVSTRLPLSQAAVFSILISAAYGATDEWHQYFVPKRSCDFSDWAADVAGSLVVILLLFAFRARRASAAGSPR